MKYPGFREALFTPADARGNAPHATREQADSEGRRLNAMRYETVKQAEQALDRRAARPLGAVPQQPQPGSGGLGGLFLLAGAALVGWALWRDSGEGNDQEDDEEDDDVGLDAPTAPPAHTPGPFTLNVTVAPAAAGEPPKVTTTSMLLPNPTPAPPKKRRRKKPVEVVAVAPPSPVTTPEV